MCGSNMMYPTHCLGCRCFAQTWPIATTTTFTTTYAPRHRKPGPAQ